MSKDDARIIRCDSMPYTLNPTQSLTHTRIMSENQILYEPTYYVETVPYSATLDPYEVAKACIRFGRPSAQSTAYLLPANFNYEVPLSEDNPDDYYEVERLVKICNSILESEKAVEELIRIEDEQERRSKPAMLVQFGRISVQQAIVLASGYPDIDRLFGHPEFCNVAGDSDTGTDFHTAYTQDKTTPVHDVFDVLNMNNDEDFEAAKSIVDAYLRAQLTLCSYGRYEATLKLLDNCGIDQSFGHGAELDEAFRIFDLGELNMDREFVESHIQEKEWEKIHGRSEYTPMHPRLQVYFNDMFETYFTIDAVRSIWGKSLQQPGQGSSHTFHIDKALPRSLPKILWKQNLEAAQAISID